MIFFIERARLGDLEIFLKFKIRIAEIFPGILILAADEHGETPINLNLILEN
jgi:hypothetical protein